MSYAGYYQYMYDYFKYYCNLNEPQFALQLEGEWGCGKTWLVNNFIKNFKQDEIDDNINKDKRKKFIYVSLFGCTKIGDINKLIFENIVEDKIGKKKGFIIGLCPAIPKAISKYIGIELTKEDIINGFYNFASKFFDNQNTILILDDYERHKMDHYELMGFISKYLNQEKIKIITICNTDNYLNDSQENAKFLDEKEKIIGMIVNVKSDPKEFLDILIKSNQSKEIQDILDKNKKELFEVFVNSKNSNLRNLIKLNENFNFLYKNIPSKLQKNDKFITNILQTYLIMIIETFGNPKTYNELFGENLSSWPSQYNIRSNTQDSTNKKNIKEFYDRYKLSKYAITPEFWKKFLCSGYIQENLIEEYYNNADFEEELTPIPMQLLQFGHMDYDKVTLLVNKMKQEMLNGQYTKPGLLLHAFGIMLFFAKNEISNNSISDIMQICNDSLVNTNFELTDSEVISFNTTIGLLGWGGFSYMDSESDEFNELYNKTKNKLITLLKKNKKNKTANLLSIIPQDIERSIQILADCGPDFKDIILEEIDPETLANNIVRIKSNKNAYNFIILILTMLKSKLIFGNPEQEECIKWCKKFTNKIDELLVDLDNIDRLLKFNLKRLNNDLKENINIKRG